jgi:hypothetical protein
LKFFSTFKVNRDFSMNTKRKIITICTYETILRIPQSSIKYVIIDDYISSIFYADQSEEEILSVNIS